MRKTAIRLYVAALHFTRELGQRIQEQGRPTMSWTLRLTASATAAYIAANALLDHQPLLAPLTALLVTQLTLYSMVRQGVDRVMAVVAGVVIATLFAEMFGLTWWSLAMLLAAALLVGQLLRLGDNLVEVPITAMFVLAVGEASAGTAAVDRAASTMIGALVGLGINVLIPPGVRADSAGAAVEKFGDEIAQQLENAAVALPDGVTIEQASGWLTGARSLTSQTNRIDRTLTHAAESRRFNVRAINTPDTTLAMRHGLDALEHCAVAIRSIFRGVNDVVQYPDDVEDIYPRPARQMTADSLYDLAYAIRSFGQLVHAQVGDRSTHREEQLIVALQQLSVSRAQATEHFRNSQDSMAVYELNVFLTATMGRVLRELDPRGHSWVNRRPMPYADERQRAAYAAKKLRALTKQLGRIPTRRGPGSHARHEQ